MIVLFGIIVAFSIVIILVCILFFDFYNDDFLLPRMHTTPSNIEDDRAEKSIRMTYNLAYSNQSTKENPTFSVDSNPTFVNVKTSKCSNAKHSQWCIRGTVDVQWGKSIENV